MIEGAKSARITNFVTKNHLSISKSEVADENTEKKLADKVRQAKKDGLIDNFIYGSVSSAYLSAVIETLWEERHRRENRYVPSGAPFCEVMQNDRSTPCRMRERKTNPYGQMIRQISYKDGR